MSKANPIKAMRALVPAPIVTACGCEVKPLTLGMYAVLERISSPLLGEVPVDGTLSLLPSLYVLTHDPSDALAPRLFERSVEWADTLPPAALLEIRDAADRQIRAMLDVVPEPKDGKKKLTAGSRPSPSGAPRPTAGDGTRSSGKPRRRPSRSSAASGDSPTA